MIVGVKNSGKKYKKRTIAGSASRASSTNSYIKPRVPKPPEASACAAASIKSPFILVVKTLAPSMLELHKEPGSLSPIVPSLELSPET